MKENDFEIGNNLFLHYCVSCDQYAVSEFRGCICGVCDAEMKIRKIKITAKINNGKCTTCRYHFNCSTQQCGETVIVCRKYENGSLTINTKLFLKQND